MNPPPPVTTMRSFLAIQVLRVPSIRVIVLDGAREERARLHGASRAA